MPDWSHNGQRVITNICEFKSDEYFWKYTCEFNFQHGNNVTYVFRVLGKFWQIMPFGKGKFCQIFSFEMGV